MEDTAHNDEKLYYKIGEVAARFNVNASLIRFWEKEFDIIKPHKDNKGNRLFTQKDLKNFYVIYNLVKEKGMTLQGAKETLKNKKIETMENTEIIQSLLNVREFLIGLKNQVKEA